MKKSKKNNKKKKLVLFFTIFVISMALFLLSFMRLEGDYFWHIKAGKYMVNHGVLKKDVFSWYLNGKYWMSHEWLFEIILYCFKVIFRGYHLLAYGFVCITSLLLILFFANKENYLKNTIIGMLWVIFAVILATFMQGRPHLISYNLLALTIWFLYDNYKNPDSKLIYFLPVVSIVWANVHGGSSNLSYLFCFMFLIVGLFNINFTKLEMKRISKKQALKYLIIALACMLCININIHGFKMFVYPYQNMLDKTMLNSIMEWQPTDLSNPAHYLYLLLVAVILFIMISNKKKKINLIDLSLFAVALVLGLKSVRFWGYIYIIMSFVIFNYIEDEELLNKPKRDLIVMSIILLSMACLNYKFLNHKLQRIHLNDEVIEIIKKEQPKRLFNMYDYGGELIYHDIPVFIDSRADLYSKYNYSDYLNISNLTKNFSSLMEKYDFDYYLVDNKFAINGYLASDFDYTVIYKDENVSLYKKNS